MNYSSRTQRIMEQLEDRILFDAVPDGDFLIPEAQEQPLFVQEQSVIETEAANQVSSRELILLDSEVENSNDLIDEILNNNPNQAFEVRLLSADRDGVEQISDILGEGSSFYSAIHIISHGSEGNVHLGNSSLDTHSLLGNAGDIALWTNSLTEDADILLYGCNLAGNDAGVEFVETLSTLTGADVAASDDITGAENQGGDWELELTTGEVETETIQAVMWQGTLDPIAEFTRISGQVEHAVTGGSLKTDNGASLAATSEGELTLPPGINGADVQAAYLYWAASGSTIDTNVTLDGTSINSDETFTDQFDATEEYFSARADVTSLVQAKGAGVYTFGGLSADNGAPFSTFSTVISGWSLVVVYEDTSIAHTNTVVILDGYELLYDDGSHPGETTINITGLDLNGGPGNITTTVFEGDNSGGADETIKINNSTVASNNIYEGSSNVSGVNNGANRFGIDIDNYDITSFVNAGDTSIQVEVSTGNNDQIMVGAVVFTVSGNDVPEAVDDIIAVNFNTPVSGNVTGNDVDNEGDTLTVSGATVDTDGDGIADTLTLGTPTQILDTSSNLIGTLTLNTDGTFTFTPDTNYAGSIPVVDYTVTDGNGGTDSAQLILGPIVAPNVAPNVTPDSLSTDEDTPLSDNVLSNDSDSDGGTLTVTSASVDVDGDGVAETFTLGSTTALTNSAGDPIGDLTLNANGTFTFTPEDDYDGPVPQVNYTVSDGQGGSASSTLDISINPINDAPTAQDDEFSVNDTATASGSIFIDNGNGADFDIDGDLFVVSAVNGSLANVGSAVSGSGGGLFTINQDGSYNFDTNGELAHLLAGETATTTITYTIVDPSGVTSQATVTVTVNGTNNVFANDDEYKVDFNETLSVDASGVLDNDVDPELTSLPGLASAISLSGAGGTAASLQNLSGNPTNNDASFELWIKPSDTTGHEMLFETGATGDGMAISLDGTEIHFEVRNNNGSNTGLERVTVDLTTLGIADPTAEFIQVVGVIDIGGNLDLYVNGVLAGSTTATGINDWAGGNGTGFGQNNSGATIGGTSGFQGDFALFRFYESALNATDVQTNYQSITQSNGPDSVSGATLVIDPSQDANASDNTISNSVSGGQNYTVPLSGTAESTGPRVSAINGVTADVGTPVTLASGALVTLNEDGSFDYDPNGQFDHLTGTSSETDTFTYTATDGEGATDTATAIITICGTNTAPMAVPNSETIDEDTTLNGDLTDNDSDPDGDTLTVASATVDTNGNGSQENLTLGSTTTITNSSGDPIGSLTVNAVGTYTFTPAANYNGPVPQVTYTISDGAETATSTLDISINPTNDAPLLSVDSAAAVTEDTGTTLTDTGSVSFSDVDAGDTHSISATYNTDAVWSDGTLSATQVASLTTGTFAVTTSGWTYSVPNSVTDFLDAGETITLSYDVTVTDGIATETQTVTVTITGADDAIVVGGTTTGTVEEDGTLQATGSLAASDIDTTDNPLNYTAINDLAGDNGFGDFSIDTSGNWTYDLDNTNTDVQALDAGETLADTFTFTVTNADGATETQTVTVTITGADDAIVVGGTTTGAVEEDGTLQATGSLTASDIDTTDNPLNYTAVTDLAGDNGFGEFSIDTSGNWTYDLDNANADVQALDAGETLADTFTFTVTNADGATETQTVTVTITGADDAIVVGGTTTGAVAEDGTLQATGSLTASDIDTTDNPLNYTAVNDLAGDNGFGEFSIDTSGNWTYDLDNANADVQALDAGETLTDTFTFTVTNADGDTETQTVTVTITGADDAIVVGGTTTGAVSEDGTLQATGSLTASDIDTTDNPLNYTAVNDLAGDNGFGDFSIDTSGNWIYDLDNANADVQALDAGETLADTFTFTVTNADGATETQTVTVTITGADDAIVVGGTTTGAVEEDGTLQATGSLAASDIDTTDNPLNYTAVNDLVGDNGFGEFSIDTSGNWTYDLDNANADVQALDAGETLTDTFTFTVTNADDATETQTVTVTITGADDAIVVGGTTTGAVEEDGTLQATGSLTASDIDTTDNPLNYTAVNELAGDNGFGDFSIDTSGNWTYDLDNTNTDVQALDAGETLTDTFTFTVTNADGDTETQTVTVTITGADDAIVVGGTTTGAVAEDGTLQATGSLTASDIDTTDNPLNYTAINDLAGDNGFGDFSIDTGGNWTYDLDNANADVQALDAGETLTDTFTFTVTNADGDTETQTVTVTITGADDAIVVGGTTTGAVEEDGTLQATGSLTASDIDTTDNPLNYTAVNELAGDNGFGDFSIDTSGNWTYDLDNTNTDVQALDAGETLTDTFTFTVTNADGAYRNTNCNCNHHWCRRCDRGRWNDHGRSRRRWNVASDRFAGRFRHRYDRQSAQLHGRQ